MATSYLSPGVYVEEVSRGSKPIEAVGTNTVGFIGESSKGPLNEPVLITNWSQFVRTFGDFKHCSQHLAHAVYGFFNNGGSRCFVVNCGAPEGATHEGTKKDEKKQEKANAAGRDGLFIGKDGGPGQRTGMRCFDEIDEISIVVAPGQISPAIQDALLSHCETRKDRFAILDSPESIQGSVDRMPRPRDSKYGAYYFPWIQVYDPEKGNIFVAPSGHIAGVYSRVDSERGVHKAPANEIVRGALELKYQISRGEQDILNPKGINAIRKMQGGGIRIWGARTLSTDPEWRYINVRRLFIMVEESIDEGTQWVVFEPNAEDLWARVRASVTNFLITVWR
ncbi:MAG: phage tail sheath subtilisin-like domain-containing protein, partial [Deltaproteobacteria bacterium]|nr:phage tail sheath subtilisin-like domain-containing protein [Deltaproteobacteria bacterium]